MQLYEASDLYKKAISRQNRELRIRTTIEGKVYSGTDVQSCNIEESILTGEDFKFGSSTASTFDLVLLNMDENLSAKSFEGKEVQIEIGVAIEKFSRPVEYISMGSFIIEKASKDNNLIKLSGFDKMILFEKPYVTNLTYPATLKQILVEICGLANVPLEDKSFVNEGYVIGYTPNLESVTLRVALEYVSELACGFALINRNSNLEIVTIAETDITIDRSNYYSMNLSEYEYGPINYVVINNEGIIEDIGEGSNILEIKDNIYAFNPSVELLNTIFNKVKDFKFKPFTTAWQGNALTAPGDIINVSYKSGETYKSFIAKQKFTFDNGLKCDISTNAKTQTQVDYETKGSVTADMGRVKASIKNLGNELRLEVEEINGSIATLNVKADNINLTVNNRITNEVASINLRADAIVLSVSGIDSRLGQAESSISVQAGLIESRVKYTDYNGSTVTSLITQDAYSISLLAQNLNLQGLVTFSNLANDNGTTVIHGGNIKTGTLLADEIYGNLFQVGRGTGSTLTMTAINGSHLLQSNDSGGFRIGSNGSMGLSASGSFGVYVPDSPLVAQAGFRVDGGATQFNTNVLVQGATLNATYLQVQGVDVATQAWVNANFVKK